MQARAHSHSNRHTFTHHQTHTRSIIRWLPWRKSEGARCCTTPVVILNLNGTPPLLPSTPLSQVAGSKPLATSPQEDWATQLQGSISWVRHLHAAASECDSHRGLREGTRDRLCLCAQWEEVYYHYSKTSSMESWRTVSAHTCTVWPFNYTLRHTLKHARATQIQMRKRKIYSPVFSNTNAKCIHSWLRHGQRWMLLLKCSMTNMEICTPKETHTFT